MEILFVIRRNKLDRMGEKLFLNKQETNHIILIN